MDFIIVGILGSLLIAFSFAISAASNFLSRLIFKFLPFISGMYLVFFAVAHLKWLA